MRKFYNNSVQSANITPTFLKLMLSKTNGKKKAKTKLVEKWQEKNKKITKE